MAQGLSPRCCGGRPLRHSCPRSRRPGAPPALPFFEFAPEASFWALDVTYFFDLYGPYNRAFYQANLRAQPVSYADRFLRGTHAVSLLQHCDDKIYGYNQLEEQFYIGGTTRSPAERWTLDARKERAPNPLPPHCERFRQMMVLAQGHSSVIAGLEKALISKWMGRHKCVNRTGGGGGFSHELPEAWLYCCIGVGRARTAREKGQSPAERPQALPRRL